MASLDVEKPSSSAAPRLGVWPLVILTGLVWGGGGLLSKGLIDAGVDSFAMTGFPFLIGGLLALVIARARGELRPSAVGPAVLLGAVNSSLPALLFNLGYETLSAGVVTLVLSLGPVFTAVAAHFAFSDERFRVEKAAGLTLAVAGVAFLAFSPGGTERPSFRGILFVLAGALTSGLTAIWSRRFAVRHGARALIAPQLLAAGLLPISMAVALGRSLAPNGGFSGRQLIVFVLIGVVASYGGFRAVMLANETGTTGQVSVVAYVIPVVGVIGGVVFFGDAITTGIAIGGALILAGLAVVGSASGKPARLARTAG